MARREAVSSWLIKSSESSVAKAITNLTQVSVSISPYLVIEFPTISPQYSLKCLIYAIVNFSLRNEKDLVSNNEFLQIQ